MILLTNTNGYNATNLIYYSDRTVCIPLNFIITEDDGYCRLSNKMIE